MADEKKTKVFIIAEAGVNHNGNIETAKKMIDEASVAGADAVKFQAFKADKLVSKNADMADYQKKNLNKNNTTQYEMLKKLEFGEKEFVELSNYCREKKIKFMASPFDNESIDFLAQIEAFPLKIPSGEIVSYPYLEKIGKLNKEVILSTGMSNLGEIEAALSLLTASGTDISKITVLHCNTEYPTPFEDVNLKAMITIKNAFPGIKVGYSDHTLGIEIPIAAAALGAEVIEKHFTLDTDMEGPDHKASLTPESLKEMVRSVRNIEAAFGDGVKKPSESEKKNIKIARKSIVAAADIEKGEVFTPDNLTLKRPGTGLGGMHWNQLLGYRANRKYKKNDFIDKFIIG
ncbi:MAG: N-acetylneuraminate synthase [Desulforegulaceae bacterium]|nr:N-acetylneuraminate synthase [Desulforegulaceae bacterium]